MKISPLNSKFQLTTSFRGEETKTEAKVNNEENEENKDKKKVVIPIVAGGAATLAALGVILGLRGCQGQQVTIEVGKDYTPEAYVGVLDLTSNYDETSLKPKHSTLDFADSSVLARYKEQGLTLKNIIDTEYFDGKTEGYEQFYKKNRKRI